MANTAEKTDPSAALLAAWPRADAGAKWAKAAQDTALARYRAMGAPARRDEYWRFTNPAPLTAVPAAAAAVLAQETSGIFDPVDHLTLVFVDGRFRADLSDELAMDACEIAMLSDTMATDIHWAGDVFGQLEGAAHDYTPRPLAALNTAVADQGVAIRVTGAAPRPIGLRYVREDATADAMVHHVVRVEAGATLTILESGPSAARFNTVMEIDIADGGTLHHVRAQGRDHERHAATGIFARLGEKSTFKSFTLTANGAVTRNEAVIEFNGDAATAHIAGACVGDGAFHHDDTVFITHDAQDCESRQVFKKVLKNGATGVFQGKILVQPDAQRTDGYQISQGLLLDDDSQFLAKPELEIYADDVACSHGSTCGSVDDEQLFYLTSRGIPRRQAENMLVISFVAEAIAEVEDETLQELLIARLQHWMERHS